MRVFSSLVIACALLFPAPGDRAHAAPKKAEGSTSFAVLYPFAGAQGQNAQSAMERLGQQIASKGGWTTAQGQLFTRASALSQALSQKAPDTLLMPLSTYLALKATHPDWKATYEVSLVSPQRQQFFLVTDDPARRSCDKASVVTHHLDDSPFVTQVVAGKSKALQDLQWVKQRRPIQVLKSLLRGQAECALIDTAQLAAARQLPGGEGISTLWSSQKLPSMVVVVQKQARSWKKVLGSLCRGGSGPVCQEVGLLGFSKLARAKVKSIEASYAAPSRQKSGKAGSAPAK